jgi:hypothetical protein
MLSDADLSRLVQLQLELCKTREHLKVIERDIDALRSWLRSRISPG